MAKRRANGEGSIRKRKDGCWEGRYTAGRDPVTGKAIYKNVLGKTQAEVKAKLKPAIEKSGVQFLRTEHYTVANGWTPGWRTMPSCKFDQGACGGADQHRPPGFPRPACAGCGENEHLAQEQ